MGSLRRIPTPYNKPGLRVYFQEDSFESYLGRDLAELLQMQAGFGLGLVAVQDSTVGFGSIVELRV